MKNRLALIKKLNTDESREDFIRCAIMYGVSIDDVANVMLQVDSQYDSVSVYNKYDAMVPANIFNLSNFKKMSPLDFNILKFRKNDLVEETFGVDELKVYDITKHGLYETVKKFIGSYEDMTNEEQDDTNLFLFCALSSISIEEYFEPYNNNIKRTFALFDRNGIEYNKAYKFSQELTSYDRVTNNTILSYQILLSIFNKYM